MRLDDQPMPPPISLHDCAALDRWPLRPVIALGGFLAAEWDDPNLIWDGTPMLVWDSDARESWLDAASDFQGIEISMGDPDEHFLFPPMQATVQLDNRSGRWSRFNADGTQAFLGPGKALSIWAVEKADGTVSWLFNGIISRWDEFSPDGMLTIEAFDSMAALAQPIGTFTPGANDDLPGPRLEAVLTAANRTAIAHTFDTGDVQLTAQETKESPLEEMQAIASSDGGVLFGDTDGTLRYWDRGWRTGRTDQTEFVTVSDNVCAAGITDVWNVVLSNNDDALANTVILENVAKVKAIAPVGGLITGSVFTETDHQWESLGEGNALANTIWVSHGEAKINVEEFELYLYDPNQAAVATSVRWRVLDLLRFVHDQPILSGLIRLDVTTLIRTITHEITPDSWLMTVQTSKARFSNATLVWNPPGDPYAWDTPDSVWGF